MTGTAVIMMIIAMLTVWGGLGVAVINLARHPEVADDEPAPPIEL